MEGDESEDNDVLCGTKTSQNAARDEPRAVAAGKAKLKKARAAKVPVSQPVVSQHRKVRTSYIMALHLGCGIIVISCLSRQEQMREKQMREKPTQLNNGSQEAERQQGQPTMITATDPTMEEDGTEDGGLWTQWKNSIYGMNPDMIAACILIGPGMAEGGASKKLRDAITRHVVVKHNLVNDIKCFEKLDSKLLGRRYKLVMSQMQFVEQVCVVLVFHVVMYFSNFSFSCDTTLMCIFHSNCARPHVKQ